MPISLQDTVALLARTPVFLNSLLRDLPDAWTERDEGPGTWSPREVVAHLVHGERSDWIPRVQMILQHGESRTFVPFDRGGHQGGMQGKSLGQLLDEFARVRAENLSALKSLRLRTEDLERRGMHPVFGPVSLSQLLATWAAHDLTHVHQISRVMAYQHRDEVGPWSAYLGVMQCSGHSALG
jgi:hypothetical protein